MSDRASQSTAEPVRPPVRSAPQSGHAVTGPVSAALTELSTAVLDPDVSSLRRGSGRPDALLGLQRSIGNRAVTRLIAPTRPPQSSNHTHEIDVRTSGALEAGVEPGTEIEPAVTGAEITRDGSQFASIPPDDGSDGADVRRAPAAAPEKTNADKALDGASATIDKAPVDIGSVLDKVGVPDPRKLPEPPPSKAKGTAAKVEVPGAPNGSTAGTTLAPSSSRPPATPSGANAKGPAERAPAATGKQPSLPPGLIGPKPAPTTAFNPNGVIDPEMARSKIDFGTWTLDEILSGGRMALELTRIIPGWGGLTGMAADITGGYQDMHAVPGTLSQHPVLQGALAIRTTINVINNAVGHLKYCSELIQDGLAGSFLFSEFVPVSATAIEAEALTKVYLDLALFFLDLGIEMGLLYNQSQVDPKSQEYKDWQGLVDGYQANLKGDVIGTVLDIASAASAGAGNTSVIKEVTPMFPLARLLVKNLGSVAIQYAQSLYNVYGSSIDPTVKGEQIPTNRKSTPSAGTGKGAPTNAIGRSGAPIGPGKKSAQAAALNAAAGIIAGESSQARIAWKVVDTGIGLVEQQANERLEELDDIVKELTGGKGLFEVIQTATLKGITALRERVDKMTQFESMAATGRSAAENVQGKADEVLAKIDSLKVPNVEIPEVDLGEGVLADLAESVANQAQSVANSALKATVAKVGESVESAKQEVRAPVESTREQIVEFIAFIAIAEKVSLEQKAKIGAYADNLENGLKNASGFEDGLNVFISQITTLLGLPEFKVQDIRDEWNRIPAYLDELDVIAKNMRLHASRLMEEEEAVAPVATAPTPPPEKP